MQVETQRRPIPDAVRKSKRGRRRVFALLLGCALALTAVELFLRITRDPNTFLPYARNAVSKTYTDPELTPGVSGVAYFTTNSYGCRGPELHGERHRLLVIGGSTAACVTLDDNEEWAHLVMQEVNEQLRDPLFLWVTNSGIDGKNSRHHVMHCRYLLPELPKIDHVLIYCGLNDVGTWLYHETFDPHDLDDPAQYEELLAESFFDSCYTSTDTPWYKKLALWKVMKQLKTRLVSRRAEDLRARGIIQEDDRMHWLQAERDRRAAQSKELVPKAKLDTLPAALDAYQRNLESMIALVRKVGAEPILMAQAIAFRNLTEQQKKQLWMGAVNGGSTYVREEEMQRFVDDFNKRMADVARENSVMFIDLPTALEGRSGLYFDGCHFTEAGASAVADVVTRALVDNVYRH